MATFKFYLREGLVPAGSRINPTRTEYSEAHVRRVLLVRALLDAGGLSVGQAKAVVATLDDGSPLSATFRAAQHAMSANSSTHGQPTSASTRVIAEIVTARGWAASEDNPGFGLAAHVIDGLRDAGLDRIEDFVATYAAAADLAAQADVAALAGGTPPESVAELMVLGTVLGDTLLAALRRLAQQHHSAIATSQLGQPPGHSGAASTSGPGQVTSDDEEQ